MVDAHCVWSCHQRIGRSGYPFAMEPLSKSCPISLMQRERSSPRAARMPGHAVKRMASHCKRAAVTNNISLTSQRLHCNVKPDCRGRHAQGNLAILMEYVQTRLSSLVERKTSCFKTASLVAHQLVSAHGCHVSLQHPGPAGRIWAVVRCEVNGHAGDHGPWPRILLGARRG